MGLVEQYRRYAGEALANARGASDPVTMQAWNEIADDWNELASQRLAWLKGRGLDDSVISPRSSRKVRWRDLR